MCAAVFFWGAASPLLYGLCFGLTSGFSDTFWLVFCGFVRFVWHCPAFCGTFACSRVCKFFQRAFAFWNCFWFSFDGYVPGVRVPFPLVAPDGFCPGCPQQGIHDDIRAQRICSLVIMRLVRGFGSRVGFCDRSFSGLLLWGGSSLGIGLMLRRTGTDVIGGKGI
ncbi:hypothetical protein McpSp1_11560 [Methanocorpusculaceae archaeon Sp1]|nr:hypothetical protein [Methanocorpusculaceae archaeon Sp1]